MYTKHSSGGALLLIVVIFADDGLVGGKSKEFDRFMSFLQKSLIVKVGEFERFLGGDYRYVLRPDGRHTCDLRMNTYMSSAVERFKQELASKSLPPLSRRRLKAPGLEIHETKDDPGWFADTVRSHVGTLLFAARLAFPGYIYYVSDLARYVANWSVVEDGQLRHLYSYISAHLEELLRFEVLQEDLKTPGSLCILVFSDADHGGDRRDRKSTSSSYVFLAGKHGTLVLLEWRSQSQKVTSTSTGESEIVAGSVSAKIGLHASMLVENCVGKIPVRLLIDSQCALAIIDAGYSKSLRYIKKTHGILISWLWEVCRSSMSKEYVPSGRNASDLGTKALPGETHDRLVRFCGVRGFGESDFDRCRCACLSPLYEEGTQSRCLEPAVRNGFCASCVGGHCRCRCWYAYAPEGQGKSEG